MIEAPESRLHAIGGGEPSLRLLNSTLRGKFYAAKALARFMRYFENWDDVWAAYRSCRTLPSLRLRGGLTLLHAPADDPLATFLEIFVQRQYTGGDFYCPSPADVVMDLGANIGIFALYMNWCAPGIRVHCFEPAGATFERLHANVSANGLDASTLVYPFAVSGHSGIGYLMQHRRSVERALARESPPVDAERVETVSFARALELSGASRLDLLKIDIEGAETEIVLDSEPGDWSAVHRVAMEFHGGSDTQCSERLAAALRERGFRNLRLIRLARDTDQGILQASR